MAADGANSCLHGGPGDGLTINIPVRGGQVPPLEFRLEARVTLDPARYGVREPMPVLAVYRYRYGSSETREHHWDFKALRP